MFRRWNILPDVSFPWNILDGRESRNDTVRFPALVEGPSTKLAVPPPAPPPEPNLPLPRVRFKETRSAEDTNLHERSEQAKAICNVFEESMGDEIDCDCCEQTETDPISPADLASGRDARSTSHTRRMFLIAICQSSLSCHAVNGRQIP